MDELISICIPTYRRPSLLRAGVESCLRQAYRPLQILIGDDSGDRRGVDALETLQLPTGVICRHVVHDPPLRQAGNVNWLFANADGE